MPRIPQHVIDQIRARADILEVISEVVQLKKRGKNWFALCPFHHEKTPSFSVNPEMGIYHCFGCGRGGNVFTFLMEYEKIDFIEAVERLAEKYGIKLEYDEKGVGNRTDTSLLYELHEIALKYYTSKLFEPEGEKALNYLKSRGLREETIKRFKIGYSPDKWDGLFNILNLSKYSLNVLKKSGLFIVSEKGNCYDRFRDRVMFPIYNLNNRVVAFAGRSLKEDDNAKYMNSPETDIYFKSATLFGLNWSKDYIRKNQQAIIVEGYTDFMRVYEGGVRNVVAVSGTAFNEHHARVLKRFANSIVLSFDGDEAGRKAAERAGYVLLEEECEVKVARLPDGSDPDDFVMKNGIEAYNKIIEEAIDFIDFIADKIAGSKVSNVEKTKLINEVAVEFANIRNPVLKEMVSRQFAERIGIEESSFFNLINRLKRKSARLESTGDKVIDFKELKGRQKAEYELIKILLHNPHLYKDFVQEYIDQERFTIEILRKLFSLIVEKLEKEGDFNPSELFDFGWMESENKFISKLMQDALDLEKIPNQEDIRTVAIDCIKRIIFDEYNEEIRLLRNKIKEKELKGELETEYLKRLSQIQKEKRDLEVRLRSVVAGDR